MQRIKDLTPNLAVEDVAASVRFYTEVLGFELRMAVSEDRQMAQGGLQEGVRYVWANVMAADVGLMLQEKASFAGDVGLKADRPGATMSLYFEVDDADAFFDELEGRVRVHKPPADTWYGAREFYLLDPDGYLLGFSSIRGIE